MQSGRIANASSRGILASVCQATPRDPDVLAGVVLAGVVLAVAGLGWWARGCRRNRRRHSIR